MNNASEIKTLDPRNMIGECYRIEGINAAQCRSVFLDWLLSAPDTPDMPTQIAVLLEQYADQAPDHPMSHVLQQGQGELALPKGRRGGWRRKPR